MCSWLGQKFGGPGDRGLETGICCGGSLVGLSPSPVESARTPGTHPGGVGGLVLGHTCGNLLLVHVLVRATGLKQLCSLGLVHV